MTSNKYEVKDSSGVHREFYTGAHRDDDTGKIRYDLLSLHGLKRQAEHMTKGAIKHGARNWEKGWPVSVSIASIWRHFMAYLAGDYTEDHLSAMKFNIDCIIHVEEGGNNQELRGMPNLMDHPRYAEDVPDSPSLTDEFYRAVAIQVVADFQVKVTPYGGTSEQLYKHCMKSALAPFDKSVFLTTLIKLMKENVIQVIEDGYHDPLWQLSDVGEPPEWSKHDLVKPLPVEPKNESARMYLSGTVDNSHGYYCDCSICLEKEEANKVYPYVDDEGFTHLNEYNYLDKNGQEHAHCRTCKKCITCKSCSCTERKPDSKFYRKDGCNCGYCDNCTDHSDAYYDSLNH